MSLHQTMAPEVTPSIKDVPDGGDTMTDAPIAPVSNSATDPETVKIGPPRTKPEMDIKAAAPGSSDLFSRLSSFLPQMKAANDQLEDERMAGRLDLCRMELNDESGSEDSDAEVEDGAAGKAKKPYIEMNLGLGVLEEKRPGKKNKNKTEPFTGSEDQIAALLQRHDGEEEEEEEESSDSSDDSDDSDSDEEDDSDNDDAKGKDEGKDGNVMGRLMGNNEGDEREHKKPRIEEI